MLVWLYACAERCTLCLDINKIFNGRPSDSVITFCPRCRAICWIHSPARPAAGQPCMPWSIRSRNSLLWNHHTGGTFVLLITIRSYHHHSSASVTDKIPKKTIDDTDAQFVRNFNVKIHAKNVRSQKSMSLFPEWKSYNKKKTYRFENERNIIMNGDGHATAYEMYYQHHRRHHLQFIGAATNAEPGLRSAA